MVSFFWIPLSPLSPLTPPPLSPLIGQDIAQGQYAFLLTSHLVSLIDCLEISCQYTPPSPLLSSSPLLSFSVFFYSLYTAYNFSHKTNKDATLQDYMTKTGAVDLFRKQEIDSISCYLTICFKYLIRISPLPLYPFSTPFPFPLLSLHFNNII